MEGTGDAPVTRGTAKGVGCGDGGGEGVVNCDGAGELGVGEGSDGGDVFGGTGVFG